MERDLWALVTEDLALGLVRILKSSKKSELQALVIGRKITSPIAADSDQRFRHVIFMVVKEKAKFIEG